MLRWFVNIYNLLLYLYPARKRAEFGDEMRAVFGCVANETKGRGWQSLMAVLLYELLDLPRNLMHEYWRAFHHKEAVMSDKIGLDSSLDGQFAIGRDDLPPASWQEMLLVAVPFLIPALFISIPQLIVLAGLATPDARLHSVIQLVLGVSMFLLLLVGLVTAWRSKWPRWSASWFLFFGLLLISPLEYLAYQLEDISRVADVFSEFAASFLLPLLIAWLLYKVTRLEPIKGLLAVLPVAVLIWQVNMEFVPNQIEASITMASLFLAALTAVALLRLRDWRVGLWLVILLIALVGLLHSYTGIHHGGSLPYTAPFPNLIEVVKNFIPQFLAVSTLVLGPFLATSFRSIGKQSGEAGRVSYRLALFGMFLILGIVLANYFLTSDTRVQNLRPSGDLWLNRMFLLGLLCYLVGVFFLGRAALYYRTMPGKLKFSLLALLTLLLPVVLMMPIMQMFVVVPNALDVFDWIYSLPSTLITILGLAWLPLVVWLVTHHNPQQNSPDAIQLVG